MSKTGGGRGTNQHQVKGTGRDGTPSAAPRRVRHEAEVQLEPEPVKALEDLPLPAEADLRIARMRPKGVERAVARLMARKTNLVFNDAKLEGNVFTEPQVRTLLEGQPAHEDARDEDINQILAISQGTDLVIAAARSGEFELAKPMSDRVHRAVGEFEALDAGCFRGEGAASGGGNVDAMGTPFEAPAHGPGGQNLRRIYARGLERIAAEYKHPAARAVAYAAFASYNQFYFDANKRTARLMMNGELMFNGLDAIVTPVTRKSEYNRALRVLFIDGDPAPYMGLLISLYDDA